MPNLSREQRLEDELVKLEAERDALHKRVGEVWQLAHDPAKCGHPRACWLDRNYPESELNYNPETHSSNPPLDYHCIMCESEAKSVALHKRVQELELELAAERSFVESEAGKLLKGEK